MEALKSWRENSLDLVDSRHHIRSDGFRPSIDDTKTRIAEIKSLIKSLSSMSSGDEITMFQDCGQLCKSINKPLADMRKSMKTLSKYSQKAEMFLNQNPVTYKYLRLTEKEIRLPVVKFIHSTDEALRIRKQGAMLGFRGIGDHDAVTDGRLWEGCFYWEMDVTAHPSGVSETPCGCRIGLVQECTRLGVDPGVTSWYIVMDYRTNTYQCWCPTNCGKIQQSYREWKPNAGPQRLGCFLDLETRNFSIFDCIQNQQIWTTYGVSTSSCLTPAVSVWSVEPQASLSVRLLSRDLSTLSPSLLKLLKESQGFQQHVDNVLL